MYVSWKFLISALTGTAIGTTLNIVNCDLAAMFGLLTFALNFIPTVGLLMAVLLPLPLVALAPMCPSDCNNDLYPNITEIIAAKWECAGIKEGAFFELSGAEYCRAHCFCGADDVLNSNGDVISHTMGVNYGMTWPEKMLAFVIPYSINLLVANFVEPMVFGMQERRFGCATIWAVVSDGSAVSGTGKRLNLHPVVVRQTAETLTFPSSDPGGAVPTGRCSSLWCSGT